MNESVNAGPVSLVAEDEVALRTLFLDILHGEGYEVLLAAEAARPSSCPEGTRAPSICC
jgi:hypothetical protein